MKIKEKVQGGLCAALALVLAALGGACVAARAYVLNADGRDAVLMAAALTMSRGNYGTEKKPRSSAREAAVSETLPKATEESEPVSSDFDSGYYNTFASHKNAEKYPVYTRQYTAGGTKYQNFYVKNSTAYDLNIGKTLKEKLGFKMENSSKVQVLIYHTHTSESYIDCDAGYYYSDFYPRTADNRYNVTRVGDEIAGQLEAAGIGVVHDKTVHDYSYNGSYKRSRATVEKYLKKYPDIKVTLDIHRDSIGDSTYKVKPTFSYKGKKGAQIMIMAGYDAYEGFNFPNWNYNLRFALKLQQTCESKFGGMTRPLSFGNFAYNMNINTGSLLIEVGTDSNTLDEAVYSGKLLGKALAEVLQKNM